MTRLHVLDLGRLHMDPALLVVRDGASAVPRAARVAVPVSAYVIEHQSGRVLFDTGCHPEAMGPQGRWPAAFQALYPWSGGAACHLPNRLAALGLGPDDFSDVVLSHLHCDHAGCAAYFRRSRLIVHADELAAAFADDGADYLPGDVAPWRALALDWHPLGRDAGDMALGAAVTVLNWGSGHAPGMLGLLVRLPRTGAVILASDAVYASANFTPPFPRPGFVHDPAGYDRTVRHIHGLARELGAQVWFGHDPVQFAKLRQAPAECYD